MNPVLWASRLCVGTILILAGETSTAAVSDSGTLTVGSLALAQCGGLPWPEYLGFMSGGSYSFGTYSPVGLTGGKTVEILADVVDFMQPGCPNLGPSYAWFTAVGFSSDPGAGWLVSITCDGSTLPAGIATYSYGTGAATWLWNGRAFAMPAGGGQTSCTITHN